MTAPEYIRKFGLETGKTNCINIHGQRNKGGNIEEIQELVIASSTMDRKDWVRTRAWSWMCSLLFFDKILQIPLVIVSAYKHIPISRLIDALLINNPQYPLLSEINEFFFTEASSIQQGGSEYYFSQEILGVYWPHDEYRLIKLIQGNHLDSFYEECLDVLRKHFPMEDPLESILIQAMKLNNFMMMTPSEEKTEIQTQYNIIEYFYSIVAGKPSFLQKGETHYYITKKNTWDNFDDWARKVIWYGNKKAAYWWPIKGV